jgi:hypothetical protein
MWKILEYFGSLTWRRSIKRRFPVLQLIAQRTRSAHPRQQDVLLCNKHHLLFRILEDPASILGPACDFLDCDF